VTPIVTKVGTVKRDGVEEGGVDVAGGVWVSPVEIGCRFGCKQVELGDPGVLTCVITPPLHQILKPPIADSAIQNYLYFILLLSVDQDGRRGFRSLTTGYRIRWCRG
jgi:hypothetical protein